ncbi:16S rRNA (adenine(1518)-N(6)/adenine(1519)-N(6))-dimethyltransferase RsmA [Helicobacter enhydrae]|uniref:16S rRNA (adenine(1518)-N(6)/adenine(1519)-N(6))- dimethyltransferase RsmA n=1 Tax=Helicobacter enhydrae TaxID=222136 RepID=UPI000AC6202D|nr:16S rRNA (adenine(1518)-N(6)/adenine(1519)-N(6))-dimethyltransferase RsmA [Helicobacter enhydrae]
MNYKAKKKFGQNFLKESIYLDQIVQSIPNTPIQVIEIGVGLGDLTERLLKFHKLIAYEVDEDLCSLLNDREFFGKDNLTLIHRDVLECSDAVGWLHKEPYFLVSNLPYYIATHIVLKLLRDPMCQGLVVMTQKEVAEKFCADVGDRDFCALSIIAQSVGNIKMLFEVPPTAFSPAPKVDSAVFQVQKTQEFWHIQELCDLETLLKCAFQAPRKKLAKNLCSLYPKAKIDGIFQDLMLDTNLRPHQVSTSLYHQIYDKLKG